VITLSAAIMFAEFSPERTDAALQLSGALTAMGADTEWQSLRMFGDAERKGPWWNARRCWQYGAEQQATHHLVMQDDIIPCNEFVRGVLQVIAARPESIISLFHGPRKAFDGSCRWGVSEGAWGQGIVMPACMVKEFLSWEQEHVDPAFPHDDSRVSLFAIRTRRRVYVPFPTLLDHRDGELKSVLGNRWSRPRVSSDFMGSRDPREFDWSETEPTMRSINSFSQYNRFLLK
jgi:hypothetical protein